MLDYARIKGLVPEEMSLRSVPRGLPRENIQIRHREAIPYAHVLAFMARSSMRLFLAVDPSGGRLVRAVRKSLAAHHSPLGGA